MSEVDQTIEQVKILLDRMMGVDADQLTELEQLALVIQLRRTISNDENPAIEQMHANTEIVSFLR